MLMETCLASFFCAYNATSNGGNASRVGKNKGSQTALITR